MKKKKLDPNIIRTDLIVEQEFTNIINLKEVKKDNILISNSKINSNNYTTITFKDITDRDSFNMVLKALVNELKRYLKLTTNDIVLIIGLGNASSTPDSLGPNVVDHILVTRYLFLLGDVEAGYSNVCSFKPNVTGNTGIETKEIIDCIIKKSNATKVIVVDALKANSLNHLTKTVQITDSGISPGSGINNNRKEISKQTTGVDIIAIGVPTVVDIKTITKDNNTHTNLIVTPTDIDFLIEKLALLISEAINISLHKNYLRQKNIS